MQLSLKSGCNLFHEGDKGGPCYIVMRGWVALFTLLSERRRRIIGFALPGAVFSANPEYSAQALTDTVVFLVSPEDLVKWPNDHFDIRMQESILLFRAELRSHSHHCSNGEQLGRGIIVNVLLDLFIRSRLCGPKLATEKIYLPLTQTEISDATGLSEKLVNRVLHKLKKDGVLERYSGRLVIVDPGKLIDIQKQAAIERIRILLRSPKVARLRGRNDRALT